MRISEVYYIINCFIGDLVGKEFNEEDVGSISGWGRSPGEGNGYPLQCSCLDNSVNREDWQATVHGGHKESDTTEWLTLSLHFHTQRNLCNKIIILSSPVKFMSVSIWLTFYFLLPLNQIEKKTTNLFNWLWFFIHLMI